MGRENALEVTFTDEEWPVWRAGVASDGPKQHGLILSLAMVDELHATATAS